MDIICQVSASLVVPLEENAHNLILNTFKVFVEPYKITHPKFVPVYSLPNDVWEERHIFLSQKVLFMSFSGLGFVRWVVHVETGGAQSWPFGAGARGLTWVGGMPWGSGRGWRWGCPSSLAPPP